MAVTVELFEAYKSEALESVAKSGGFILRENLSKVLRAMILVFAKGEPLCKEAQQKFDAL